LRSGISQAQVEALLSTSAAARAGSPAVPLGYWVPETATGLLNTAFDSAEGSGGRRDKKMDFSRLMSA
jgi:hypothetical protein